MSSEVSREEIQTEVIYETIVEESSEEPPMDEWSSLVIELPEENRKRVLYEEGLYDPGSGEICTKYISMSASSVLRHPYFNYPAVIDPGIKEALLEPEDKITYPDDGQILYLTVCKEMNQCPVMIFYEGLLDTIIDLKYYCVNPYGVRPMAMALSYNRNVTTLILTDNFLNDDACFHLGQMLMTNSTLTELNMSGCKIGPKGFKMLLSGLLLNRRLHTLNLNRNKIGDLGMEFLASSIIRGIDVKELYLGYNNITGQSANVLAEALETYNKFTYLDLSWNNLAEPVPGTFTLFGRLSENKFLQELYLSWNALSGPRMGTGIKYLFKIPNLRILDLSHNRLMGDSISNFVGFIAKAKKLVTLDLSYNPMTPDDALKVLQKMKLNTVKIQNLLMENVFVNGAFLLLLEQVKAMKIRHNSVITYGGVIGGFRPVGPDMRDLVLNRVEFLTTGKKKKVDIALVVLQMQKDKIDIMLSKSFEDAINESGAPLDNDLVGEIINAFAGPKSAKSKTISISLLADFIQRKWPDRKLPPTPPPELEPELQPAPEIAPPAKPQKKKKG